MYIHTYIYIRIQMFHNFITGRRVMNLGEILGPFLCNIPIYMYIYIHINIQIYISIQIYIYRAEGYDPREKPLAPFSATFPGELSPDNQLIKVFLYFFMGGSFWLFIVGLFCYICIFYHLCVEDLTYAFGWSAFLCRSRFCDTTHCNLF
jgi:hypothetical protein